jgi:hypothetical protein
MSFEMVPEDVVSHASAVQGLAGDLRAAGERGGTVDLGIETYGIICQPISAALQQHIADMGRSINEIASALPEIADALRDTADSTRETDGQHAELFDQYRGGA